MLIPPFAEKMFPTLGKCFSFFSYFFLLERDKEILPALSLKERNPKENHCQNVPYFQFSVSDHYLSPGGPEDFWGEREIDFDNYLYLAIDTMCGCEKACLQNLGPLIHTCTLMHKRSSFRAIPVQEKTLHL